jgi:hypothetical protein
MKNSYFKSFAILTLIAVCAVFSFGQAVDNQNPENDSESGEQTVSNKVRVGVTLPKAAFREGVDNNQMALGIRELVGQYLEGSDIEIVPLEARLDSAVKTEAAEKGCAYILNVSVTQKKGGGGFGMFKKIAPVVASVVPMAGVAGGVAGQVASSVAQTAIMSVANMSSNTKSKDQFTLEYSLNTIDGTVKKTETFKAKAQSDGEDVISPMMEKMAEAIVANAR